MKRILFLLTMQLCLLTVNAQNPCKEGDDNPPEQNDPENIPAGDATSSGQLSYDPNEITGSMGYDSIHWVSVKDVLNYTILLENDPSLLRLE